MRGIFEAIFPIEEAATSRLVPMKGKIHRKAPQLIVAGAETFLEYLANGKDYVKLHIKAEDFFNATHIHKVDEDEWGGTFVVQNKEIKGHQLWLCNVTKFVFGQHPNDIYFEVCG